MRTDESELRNVVTGIWKEILGFDTIDTNAHFIECGGTSIAAEQLAARIHESAGIEITGYEIISLGTIEQILELLLTKRFD